MENYATKVKSKVENINPQKREGPVASMIEEQTAKIPSDVYLWAALGAMTASLAFKIFRRDETSLFIGQWAPAFLLFGVYNKLVKQLGHDSRS